MNRNLNVRKLPGKVGYLLLPPPPHILGHQVIMHHDQNVAMAYNIITQRDTINSQAAPTARALPERKIEIDRGLRYSPSDFGIGPGESSDIVMESWRV